MSNGNTDIWTLDVDRGIPVRFTDDLQADIAPVWCSPQGDRIVYSSILDGVFELFERKLDGSPATLLLARHNYIVAAGAQRCLVDTVVEQAAAPPFR